MWINLIVAISIYQCYEYLESLKQNFIDWNSLGNFLFRLQLAHIDIDDVKKSMN